MNKTTYYDLVSIYYIEELAQLEQKAAYQFGNAEIKAWLLTKAYLRAQKKAKDESWQTEA